jgi:NADPH:quinone reductase-like Zn-dependent oxidoreductase
MPLKRIQYHRYGGPEEMRLEAYDQPGPGKDEILVRVKASSVNPVDWKIRQGAMKLMTGRGFPRAMGTDFSGVVEQVGADVTRFRAGDEIFGTVPVKPSGAFAHTLITKEKLAVNKPASISHEAAAALPLVGATAWRGLVEKGRLKPGQRVFVNGAYGGVGQAAVQIAMALGASAAGRVGPSALLDARAMGVDPALDYTQEIPTSLHRTFDLVFDCNGNLSPSESEALIQRGGVVLDINPTGAKFARSLFSRRYKIFFGSQDAEILQKVADLAGNGKLSISIGRRATLEDAIAVISDLEAGRRAKGKAVIIMA